MISNQIDSFAVVLMMLLIIISSFFNVEAQTSCGSQICTQFEECKEIVPSCAQFGCGASNYYSCVSITAEASCSTPGFYLDASHTCVPCPFGSYCPGNSTILTCAYGNTTSTGSMTSTRCICNSGYFGTGGSCQKCPPGYQCPGGSTWFYPSSQSIANATASTATTLENLNEWAYDPTSKSYYASQYMGTIVKFDSRFNKLWEIGIQSSGFDSGNNIGTHAIATHPNGNILVCGESWSPVNGANMIGDICDFFYMYADPNGTNIHTKRGGNMGWDYCFDIQPSRLDPQFYYVVGFKTGNYLTASSTGGGDPYILKVRVSDGSTVWSATRGVDSVYDVGYAAAEISSTVVQILISTSKLVSFDASTGAYLSNVALCANDIGALYFEPELNYWLGVRAVARQFVAVDSAGALRFSFTFTASFNPSTVRVDMRTSNLFIGFTETNSFAVAQIGLLSGRVFWYRWSRTITTQNLNAIAVYDGNLVIGGNNFARFLPNVTFVDTCPPGQIVSSLWTCTSCPSGTFSFNNSCLSCPKGSYCLNGIQTECPNGDTVGTGARNASQCICNSGYFGSNASCTICQKGRYCPGGTSMVSCGSKASTSGLGSFNESQCICDPGYFRNAGVCVECPLASFCPGGRVRQQCMSNSNTSSPRSTSSSQCICNPGFFKVDSSCVECPFGSFCSGPSQPKECGTNSNTTQTKASSVSQCICDPGFYGSNGTCTACPVGYFCPSGTKEAIQCPANSFTATSMSVASNQCICLAGHYLTGAACQKCPSGMFQKLTGQSACIYCPIDSDSCDSIQFTCKAGYTLASSPDDCVRCAPGTFKSQEGNDPCQPCPESATLCNSTSYECFENRQLLADGKCPNKNIMTTSELAGWWIRNPLFGILLYICGILILFTIAFLAGFRLQSAEPRSATQLTQLSMKTTAHRIPTNMMRTAHSDAKYVRTVSRQSFNAASIHSNRSAGAQSKRSTATYSTYRRSQLSRNETH